jgi:redox-sensitive bicupin YhaK (pirin superfamily)
VFARDQPARIAAGAAAARCMIIGGEALDGPRFIRWNFVSSRRERIDQARRDWIDQAFDPIPGETEWIPYPSAVR